MKNVNFKLSYADVTALDCILDDYVNLARREVTQLQNTKLAAGHSAQEAEARKMAIKAQTSRMRNARKLIEIISKIEWELGKENRQD